MTKFKLLILFAVTLVTVQSAVIKRRISLAFVIDLTESMEDDLYQVQTGTKMILNKVLDLKKSPIENYVLQVFSDPNYSKPFVTRNATAFERKLESLSLIENMFNFDCPEPSLSGIMNAAKVVMNESTLYVFTDATAADYQSYPSVLRILKSKGLKVVFILTGDCGKNDSPMLEVYYKMANATNGQVFKVKKSNVLEYMELLLKTFDSYEMDDTDVFWNKSQKSMEIRVKPEDKVMTIQVTGKNHSGTVKGLLYDPQGNLETEEDGLKVHFKGLENIYSVTKVDPEPGKWLLQLVSKSTDFTRKVMTVKNESLITISNKKINLKLAIESTDLKKKIKFKNQTANFQCSFIFLLIAVLAKWKYVDYLQHF